MNRLPGQLPVDQRLRQQRAAGAGDAVAHVQGTAANCPKHQDRAGRIFAGRGRHGHDEPPARPRRSPITLPPLPCSEIRRAATQSSCRTARFRRSTRATARGPSTSACPTTTSAPRAEASSRIWAMFPMRPTRPRRSSRVGSSAPPVFRPGHLRGNRNSPGVIEHHISVTVRSRSYLLVSISVVVVHKSNLRVTLAPCVDSPRQQQTSGALP